MEKVKKGLSKNKKIGLAAAIIAVSGILLILLAVTGKKGYRVIQIYNLDGTATIERANIGILDAYENLMLKSEDLVTVASESTMRLKLDEDKYLLVEEETVLAVYATGDSENSRTDIHLQQGSATMEIQRKLSRDSSYQVTTPNAVMSVRGTVFRVAMEPDENGILVTRVSTFDGIVAVQKINADGSLGEEVLVGQGRELFVYKEGKETVVKESAEISYQDLPDTVLELLVDISAEGNTSLPDKEKIGQAIEEREGALALESTELTEKTHTVTFLYQGSVFGMQTVKDGEKAAVPALRPDETGSWDYDFDQPVIEDIAVEFR